MKSIVLIQLLQTFEENYKYGVRLCVTFVAGINTGNFNVIRELLYMQYNSVGLRSQLSLRTFLLLLSIVLKMYLDKLKVHELKAQ